MFDEEATLELFFCVVEAVELVEAIKVPPVTMMLNEYVADKDNLLLSLIVTDIGNVPVSKGSLFGVIIRLGNEPVTKPEADPRFMLTKILVSPSSGSIIVGNLKAWDFPKGKVKSAKLGENKGGPILGATTGVGEIGGGLEGIGVTVGGTGGGVAGVEEGGGVAGGGARGGVAGGEVGGGVAGGGDGGVAGTTAGAVTVTVKVTVAGITQVKDPWTVKE